MLSSAAIFVDTIAQTTHSQSCRQCEVPIKASDSGLQKGAFGGPKQLFFLRPRKAKMRELLPGPSSCSWSTWQRPTGIKFQEKERAAAEPSAILIRAVGGKKQWKCRLWFYQGRHYPPESKQQDGGDFN